MWLLQVSRLGVGGWWRVLLWRIWTPLAHLLCRFCFVDDFCLIPLYLMVLVRERSAILSLDVSCSFMWNLYSVMPDQSSCLTNTQNSGGGAHEASLRYITEAAGFSEKFVRVYQTKRNYLLIRSRCGHCSDCSRLDFSSDVSEDPLDRLFWGTCPLPMVMTGYISCSSLT